MHCVYQHCLKNSLFFSSLLSIDFLTCVVLPDCWPAGSQSLPATGLLYTHTWTFGCTWCCNCLLCDGCRLLWRPIELCIFSWNDGYDQIWQSDTKFEHGFTATKMTNHLRWPLGSLQMDTGNTLLKPPLYPCMRHAARPLPVSLSLIPQRCLMAVAPLTLVTFKLEISAEWLSYNPAVQCHNLWWHWLYFKWLKLLCKHVFRCVIQPPIYLSQDILRPFPAVFEW